MRAGLCCAAWHCSRRPTERCIWCVTTARRVRRRAARAHSLAGHLLARALPVEVVLRIMGDLGPLPPLPPPFACRPCGARAFVACPTCVPPAWAPAAEAGGADDEDDTDDTDDTEGGGLAEDT